ncbi:MAG: T9SS type A sorting domain-containing protein [Ignavibacteria bacterium]|nr:T9SS type A sorting domain-containing protein [Ignavibacteria bacterium]
MLKTSFFLIILFLLNNSFISAQQYWKWKNPYPQGNSFTAVYFINEEIGYGIGEFGVILRTTNGGAEWAQLSSGTVRTLRAVYFFDSDNGFVAGDSGTILRTTNAGDSWTMQNSTTFNTLRGISFATLSQGLIVGSSGTIVKTTDGGTTWNLLTSGITARLNSVAYINADTATAVGTAGGGGGTGTIIRTTNGGTTWALQTTILQSALNGVAFYNTNIGFIAGSNNRLLRTINGGTTWIRDTVQGSWNAIANIDSLTCVAVGQNGVIVKTTNGSTWNSQTSGVSNHLTGVSFKGNTIGTVVGSLGIVIRTSNGGDSWIQQSRTVTTSNLFGVFFVNRTIGFVGVRSGVMLKTTNGGDSWIQQSYTAPGIVSSVYFNDENIGTAVTDSGAIIRTNDGGNTWLLQQSNTTSVLNFVQFVNENTGVVVGSNSTILFTTNGGENWIPSVTGLNKTFRCASFVSENLCIVVGDTGTIIRTTNKGETWMNQHYSTSNFMRGVHFSNEQNGVVVGSFGMIIKTTDGGTTWSEPNSGTQNTLRAISFSDEENGTAVGENGTIVSTTNGGTSWSIIATPTINRLSGISMTSAATGTIVGNNGTILRTQSSVFPPDTPSLLSPENNATNQSITPLVNWNAVTGATSYRLQVAKDSLFANVVTDKSNIQGTLFELSSLNSFTKYFWRVRAKNNEGVSEFSDTWNFTTRQVAVPSVPTLISPENGAVNQEITLIATWNASDSAIVYRLQVAKDSLFETIVVDISEIENTSKEIGPLSSNTKYFWRVSAQNVGGSSEFSEKWNFTTKFIAPSNAPTLVSPENNATEISTKVVLVWNYSQGADNYGVQVATDSLFENLIVNDSTVTDTTKKVTLASLTTYYWRVDARNAGGNSAYSNIWSFTTVFVPIPSVPVLMYPQNNSVHQPRIIALEWEPSLNAETYLLQIATDSLFEVMVLEDSTIVETTKEVELLGITKYYWRVRAKNVGGISNFSDVWNFTTIIAPPTVPQLVSPQNNATNVSLVINLRWRKTERTETYRLQLSTDSLFETFVVDDSTLVDTLREVGPLAYNTRYFWRVSAKNFGGTSEFSNVRRFSTVISPPPAPTLLTPENGATNLPQSILFTWNLVGGTGFVIYHLQLSIDSLFATYVVNDSNIFGNTQLQVNGLQGSTQYYWRVRARNNSGYGEFSTVWNFSTATIPPLPPVLLFPFNGSQNIPREVLVRWRSSLNAELYHLQIALDTAFENFVVNDTSIADTMKLVGPLQFFTKHYWRVRAKNNTGYGDWSLRRSFTTLIQVPQQVMLLAPEHNATISSDSIIFRWNKSFPEVNHYGIVIALDTAFANIVYADTSVLDTQKVVRGLINDRRYWWKVSAHNITGWGQFSEIRKFTLFISGVAELGGIPKVFSLEQNYPNPFNPSTIIEFHLPQQGFVTLNVFDVLGNNISTLLHQEFSAGNFAYEWNASDVPSGIYFYRISVAHENHLQYSKTNKLILLK